MLAPGNDPLRDPDYFKSLKYPLLVSPKLDGIRCVTRTVPILDVDSDFTTYDTGIYKNVCLSRELKELPSSQVQRAFCNFSDLDGELIVGNETDFGVYNRTQSHIMSVSKPAESLHYRVFDTCDDSLRALPFEDRLEHAEGLIKAYTTQMGISKNTSISIVPHILCKTYDELIEQEELRLEEGYEGLMMRDPNGYYKCNRGTFKEGLIYKLKRFQDDEALITGFEEANVNNNEQTRDERGYATRSAKKEGLVAADTLGKFIVVWNSMELRVAPGVFTHKQRKEIWDNREQHLYKYLKFRYFSKGVKNLPRFPRALGFRDKIDMGLFK